MLPTKEKIWVKYSCTHANNHAFKKWEKNQNSIIPQESSVVDFVTGRVWTACILCKDT